MSLRNKLHDILKFKLLNEILVLRLLVRKLRSNLKVTNKCHIILLLRKPIHLVKINRSSFQKVFHNTNCQVVVLYDT